MSAIGRITDCAGLSPNATMVKTLSAATTTQITVNSSHSFFHRGMPEDNTRHAPVRRGHCSI